MRRPSPLSPFRHAVLPSRPFSRLKQGLLATGAAFRPDGTFGAPVALYGGWVPVTCALPGPAGLGSRQPHLRSQYGAEPVGLAGGGAGGKKQLRPVNAAAAV